MAGLEAMQRLIEEKGHLLASCTTRWFSTERSVTYLKTCFASDVLSLQQEAEERSDAKAVGLSSLMIECLTTLLLCDALPHITYLSKAFRRQTDYSIISPVLCATIQSLLNQLKVWNGVNLAGLDAHVMRKVRIGTILGLSLQSSNPSFVQPSSDCPRNPRIVPTKVGKVWTKGNSWISCVMLS